MADYFPNVTSGNTDYVQALQQSTNPGDSAPSNVMGQADFLRLLTTQLQNQDPSKPMDPTAFVTDLTQMSQLEATTKMNESILAMTASFQNMQTMQAASIIGKNVQVTGEDFSHTQGQSSQFRLNSELPLTDVTVVISDEYGVVKELNVADMSAGEKTIDWNGLDNVDVSRPSGVYSLTAYGTDANGELQSIDTVVGSRVNSVGVNSDGSMTLTLATGERVSMDTVREISG
ncbi:basal-body rod modification protein FlgD [Thiomicrorhabdus immobilis]|uniref:Basal-body rod modification protein FlgD n=1 Tax=Thiomicrorhabdus immobilis TaxID=2791037 RepID=A0ABM7MC54_9GAMM|nr:flagellar hook capping FlgD N-terminal domain-containing protein [Thiomicrorhabdus immobilis]BCN92964.1 basal-body rod modification protein FlgD [Thiomicrorhabdus immobilis]